MGLLSYLNGGSSPLFINVDVPYPGDPYPAWGMGGGRAAGASKAGTGGTKEEKQVDYKALDVDRVILEQKKATAQKTIAGVLSKFGVEHAQKNEEYTKAFGDLEQAEIIDRQVIMGKKAEYDKLAEKTIGHGSLAFTFGQGRRGTTTNPETFDWIRVNDAMTLRNNDPRWSYLTGIGQQNFDTDIATGLDAMGEINDSMAGLGETSQDVLANIKNNITAGNITSETGDRSIAIMRIIKLSGTSNETVLAQAKQDLAITMSEKSKLGLFNEFINSGKEFDVKVEYEGAQTTLGKLHLEAKEERNLVKLQFYEDAVKKHVEEKFVPEYIFRQVQKRLKLPGYHDDIKILDSDVYGTIGKEKIKKTGYWNNVVSGTDPTLTPVKQDQLINFRDYSKTAGETTEKYGVAERITYDTKEGTLLQTHISQLFNLKKGQTANGLPLFHLGNTQALVGMQYQDLNKGTLRNAQIDNVTGRFRYLVRDRYDEGGKAMQLTKLDKIFLGNYSESLPAIVNGKKTEMSTTEAYKELVLETGSHEKAMGYLANGYNFINTAGQEIQLPRRTDIKESLDFERYKANESLFPLLKMFVEMDLKISESDLEESNLVMGSPFKSGEVKDFPGEFVTEKGVPFTPLLPFEESVGGAKFMLIDAFQATGKTTEDFWEFGERKIPSVWIPVPDNVRELDSQSQTEGYHSEDESFRKELQEKSNNPYNSADIQNTLNDIMSVKDTVKKE